ncbi:EF-hand domain-containing protein [Acetobacter sp. DsW_063]|uniref:EF-hand domain-containing protein n=1 Tax=Acetobacter sp. DsW_063 TaxID=1514894 RepID=UPI000A383F20|nr:EF-hand domain-containing protein [Acetobacter sp. DsW_063]
MSDFSNRAAAARVLFLPFAVGVAGIVLSDVVQAQDGPRDQRTESFRSADTNRDGRISEEEFEAFVKIRLGSSGGMRAAMFNRLTPEEQKARLDEKFAQMDASGKGYLTLDDWRPQS